MKGIILIVLAFFAFWFVSATGEVLTGTSMTEQVDLSKINNNAIKNVTVNFCNDWFDNLTKNLNFSARPWQKKEICIVFANTSDESITILSNFVSASVNNNWNLVCDIAWVDTWKMQLDLSDISTWIVLWAKENIIKKIYVYFDKNLSGNQYACLTIQLPTTEKAWAGSMFNMVVRQASNISMIISGKPYSYQWFDNIILTLKNNLNTIYKILIGIFSILIVYNIFDISKDKKKKNHKK